MKAVLMAGGFGTRLRPLTCNIPKPMVPVMNRPMMEYIVELLRKHGITDIVVLLYYQPHVIRNHFGDGSAFGVNIEYVQAEADFGTAGSVRNAAARIGNERFLIISGDVLTNFDLSAAMEFHEQVTADITMILTHVANPLSFGIVMTDEQHRVIRFLEKPSWGGVFSDTVNTGIYIIDPHILDLIPYKQEFDFSKQLFPDMLSSGFGLYGFVAQGYWRDIGNLHEYHEVHLDFLMGKIDLGMKGLDTRVVGTGEAGEQRFHNLVGEGTNIAPTAVVSNSVIGKGCTIGERVRAHNAIIWDGVNIGNQVEITNSVVCSGTVIHDRALISDNVFIGERCIVGAGAKLMSNIKVWPEKVIQDDAVLSKSLVWEDKWLRELFTEARVTGLTNVEINPEFAARLGAALGAMVGTTRPVIASRDMSVASRMIKRSIAAGLMSMGCSVTDLQIMPIPLVRQELRSGKHAAGFHVRCSPYDATKTDIVFFDGTGRDLSLSERKSIERLFFGEDYMRAKFNAIGNLRFPERTPEMYRDRFLSSIDSAVIRDAKFSLVINYSHGISSTLFPAILGDFKCQVVSLDAYLDMQNLARNPDEFWEDYRQVGEIVASLRYDAGFLLDV
ncbi:MAG: NTP transferase domain-containing protein, partial [Chlorobi bacterium]|nr:NTP transferase domain-containing protein [Chlorobiota bacterium]